MNYEKSVLLEIFGYLKPKRKKFFYHVITDAIIYVHIYRSGFNAKING